MENISYLPKYYGSHYRRNIYFLHLISMDYSILFDGDGCGCGDSCDESKVEMPSEDENEESTEE